MEREGIYFFHIPKTAGTSVWRFLEQSFSSDEICPCGLWDQLITVSRSELEQWQIFRGHFLSHLEPYLGRSLRTFTMLRDPVERTISHYYHVRRAPEHPYHKYALRMSLAEFCVHPETRHMVENYQAAYLAKTPCDPLIAAQGLSPEDLARFELQRRMEHPDKTPASEELFERAEARLTRFTAVGITENFDNSLLKVSRSLKCLAPIPFAPQNINPERARVENVDSATLALVRDLTRVDQRLYQSTIARSQQRYLHWTNGYDSSLKTDMISYAQNFEDVILQRVFRDRKNGFYIDVGAMDPVNESVTKFFYDQGWSGINIEPNEFFYNKLVQERRRDINLNLALGEREERRTLYVFEQYGISTFDQSNRDRFVEQGYESEEKSVKVTTLAAVCQEHVTQQIDFLKIDCEGWEKLAIEGADWSRFRPIVLVIEATEPLTTIPAWQEWEPPLIENALYDMVYFDGLNRFYLRRESADLRCHFKLPPNVFDEFKLYATEKAEQISQALEQERESLAGRIAELEQKLNEMAAEIQRLQEHSARDQSQIAELHGKARVDAAEIERVTAELLSAQARTTQLDQTVLKTRLWVGQLSQELAASKRR